jgi:hypothetical protein
MIDNMLGGEGMMVFATSYEIRSYFLTSQTYYPIARKQNNLRGVAYDGLHFYWTSLTHGFAAIFRSEIGSEPESIVTSGLNVYLTTYHLLWGSARF